MPVARGQVGPRRARGVQSTCYMLSLPLHTFVVCVCGGGGGGGGGLKTKPRTRARWDPLAGLAGGGICSGPAVDEHAMAVGTPWPAALYIYNAIAR